MYSFDFSRRSAPADLTPSPVMALDIQQYLTKGVEAIVKDALRATLRDPRESTFMLGFARASELASLRRQKQEAEGLHVPSYLIASITSSCNLHCAGCYSRANNATVDCAPSEQLATEQWADIFDQAEELGISFILLAGGEPLLRADVIRAAGKRKNILFPIFTNGTFLNRQYLDLFDRCRNLVPVISIEGGEEITDARRGEGIYEKLLANMEELHSHGLIFGNSITVTTENMQEVLSDPFVTHMEELGAKAAIYIEFVPVTEEAQHLAPGEEERTFIRARIEELRLTHPGIVFVDFPGDEKSSGGCLAAGRGFFHINSHGGAEPCPFSPYSDCNVAETSLRDALASELFLSLRDGGHLMEDHTGGCVLYEKRALVEQLLNSEKSEGNKMENTENLLCPQEEPQPETEEVPPNSKQLQLERIGKYEAVLDDVLAFLVREDRSAEDLEATAEKVAALEAYYTSLAWRQDFHDEEDGLLPNTLKRGVLSEDGIYNALEAWQDLMAELNQDNKACDSKVLTDDASF